MKYAATRMFYMLIVTVSLLSSACRNKPIAWPDEEFEHHSTWTYTANHQGLGAEFYPENHYQGSACVSTIHLDCSDSETQYYLDAVWTEGEGDPPVWAALEVTNLNLGAQVPETSGDSWQVDFNFPGGELGLDAWCGKVWQLVLSYPSSEPPLSELVGQSACETTYDSFGGSIFTHFEWNESKTTGGADADGAWRAFPWIQEGSQETTGADLTWARLVPEMEQDWVLRLLINRQEQPVVSIEPYGKPELLAGLVASDEGAGTYHVQGEIFDAAVDLTVRIEGDWMIVEGSLTLAGQGFEIDQLAQGL